MQHKKIIQPTNPSENPPDVLPDRSNLSKLYVSSNQNKNNPPVSTAEPTPSGGEVLNYNSLNRALVGLLLVIPIVATYLAAVFIYHGADANIANPDPLFPVQSFFVSALWLFFSVVSLRFLLRHFNDRSVPMSGFVIIYLFYILPIIKITYNLFPTNLVGIIMTTALWLIANWLIVFYLSWALGRNSTSSLSRFITLALPFIVLATFAVILK